jgi:PRC-barrel domain
MTEASAFTGTLVAANKKLIGATVNNLAGAPLGTVDDLMIDSTGRVFYAVLSFGGVLGVGKQYYPVPWELLAYHSSKGEFAANLDKTRMENAPNFGLEDIWWTRRFASDVDGHYGINRPPSLPCPSWWSTFRAWAADGSVLVVFRETQF